MATLLVGSELVISETGGFTKDRGKVGWEGMKAGEMARGERVGKHTEAAGPTLHCALTRVHIRRCTQA